MSSVEDYMSTRLVMRDSKSSVLEVAKVMVDLNVSSVAITDEKEEEQQQQNNKQFIGILTERDIVKSIAKGVSPNGVTAGSLMSSYPILSIRKDQPIEEAALLMIRNKVRHLLVEDDADTTIAHSRGGGGRIIGMITTTDLARYLKKKTKETIIPTSKEGNEKQLQRQEEQQQQPQPQQEYSSETLLSEAWELYF